METFSTASRSFQSQKPSEATPLMWLKYIWNRIHRLQFNWNMIVTGDTGSGKTKFATTLAYVLNPKRFNADYYTNSVADFLDIVENKTKKGDTVVFDETGANLSAREWYSIGNILAGQALQTYRNKNLCVIFCTPDPSFTDIQLRRLLNCFVVMKRYNVSQSYADIREVWVDRKSSKVGWPNFKFSYDNKRYKISRIQVTNNFLNLVPDKIVKEIVKKDTKFKNAVLAKAKEQAQDVEHIRLGLRKTVKDVSKAIINSPEMYKNKLGNWDWHLVKAEFDVSRDFAQSVVKIVGRDERILNATK